jgi:hypothetical protein
VARRIGHVERAPTGLDALASGQRHEIAGGHWRELSPQLVHAITVDARRALDQLRRVHHVLDAALVHEHFDVRVRSDDRSCGAGVIEVDMSQQDVADVRPSDAVRLQPEFERLQTSGWTGIDDGDASMALHERGCYDLRAPTELEIDPRESMTECVHSTVTFVVPEESAEIAVSGSKNCTRIIGLDARTRVAVAMTS